MKRIKANQIADGYLSEGMDEGINPEYVIADEVEDEIDEVRKLLFEGLNVMPINKIILKNSTDLLNWRTRTIKYFEYHSNKGE